MRQRIGSAAAALLAAAAIACGAAAQEDGGKAVVDLATKRAAVGGEPRCVLEATLRVPPDTAFPGATLQPLPVVGYHGTLEFEAGGGPWVAWMPVAAAPDCAGAPRVTGVRLLGCGDEPARSCAGSLLVRLSERDTEIEIAEQAGPEPSLEEGAFIAVRSWRRYLVVAFPGLPPERNFRVCEELTDLHNAGDRDIVGLSIARSGGAGGASGELVLDRPVPSGAAAVLDKRLVATADCGEAPPPKPIAVSRCRLIDGADCRGGVHAFHVGRD